MESYALPLFRAGHVARERGLAVYSSLDEVPGCSDAR